MKNRIKSLFANKTSIILSFFIAICFFDFYLYAKKDAVDIVGESNQLQYLRMLVFYFIGICSLVFLTPYLIKLRFKEFRFEHIIYLALIVLMAGTLFHPKFNTKYMALLGVISIINLIITRKAHKPHPIIYFYLGAYVIYVVGLIWSIDLNGGLSLLSTKLAMILFPVCFCFFNFKNEETLKTIMLIFFRICLIFIVASLLSWLIQSIFLQIKPNAWILFEKKAFTLGIPVYQQIFAWSNYDHPSYIGIALSVGYILGFFLAFEKKQNKLSITFLELIIYSIGFLLLIIITQSRIGIVLFATIPCYFISLKLKLYLRIIFWGLCISLSIYGIQKKANTYKIDPVREQQYKIAASYIKENPIIGIGTGGIKQIMTNEANAKRVGYDYLLEPNTTYPHNQFIGETLHLGVLGILALLLVIVPLSYFAIKQKNHLLIILLICYLELMLIDMPIYHQRGTAGFFLFTTIFLYFDKLKYKKS